MFLEKAGQTEMTNEQPVKLSYILITFYLSLVYRQERIIDLFSSTKMESVTIILSQHFVD